MPIIGRTYRHNKTGVQIVLLRPRNGGREYLVSSAANRREYPVRTVLIHDGPAPGGYSIVPKNEYAGAREQIENLQAA